ncbi:hypothetical protein Trco_006896 [Trichoderma cornu-damae]|uniref:Uncharacterized protein n=1 Tax=Trichoderma cornu-damae TaxID=654480 RepID=A0A9P8QHL7_9HYPO|nr:hypothetical protein Trco_006896 [Trichoderma cornu-damae]
MSLTNPLLLQPVNLRKHLYRFRYLAVFKLGPYLDLDRMVAFQGTILKSLELLQEANCIGHLPISAIGCGKFALDGYPMGVVYAML